MRRMTEGSVEEGRYAGLMEGGNTTDGGVDVKKEDSGVVTCGKGREAGRASRRECLVERGGYLWSPGRKSRVALDGRSIRVAGERLG